MPSLFALGATALAVLLLELDRRLAAGGIETAFLYDGGPEAARSVLIMLAGSMLGTAGVTFSITIVVLSLASSQFGPRLLRNFLRDRGNQVVLGTFAATFLYCLLVLRSVVASRPTPGLAVSAAIALATTSLGVLIYFFHHVASSIQATHVVAAVARELEAAIERFTRGVGSQEHVADDPAELPVLERARGVPATRSGYVQAVDHGGLLALALERGLVLEAVHRAGDFVVAGGELVRAAPAERLQDGDDGRLRRAFLIGGQPTEEQDLEYAVRQLVEVALRALSPGINDPFTAMNCIDWLGVALADLGARGMPSRYLRDGEGRVRVITDAPSFAGVADAAFRQIRQAAAGQVAVSIRLLDTLASVAPHLRTPAHLAALHAHADHVLAASLAASPIDADRAALTLRYEAARRALESAADGI